MVSSNGRFQRTDACCGSSRNPRRSLVVVAFVEPLVLAPKLLLFSDSRLVFTPRVPLTHLRSEKVVRDRSSAQILVTAAELSESP
jgi:hypothetical protein